MRFCDAPEKPNGDKDGNWKKGQRCMVDNILNVWDKVNTLYAAQRKYDSDRLVLNINRMHFIMIIFIARRMFN
jgi:hypothetical protein